jgi:hypothetical protein
MDHYQQLVLVDRVVAVVLRTITDTEARDHTARCLQDTFGAPASQASRILEVIKKEHA